MYSGKFSSFHETIESIDDLFNIVEFKNDLYKKTKCL